MAHATGISHHHLHRTSKQEIKDEKLRDQIEQTWNDHSSYGQTRLSIHLKVNKKRIGRVMKKFALKPPKRKIPYCTKKSRRHHTYTNLIKDFVPTRANQVWVSDVSYFRFMGRWWYLATVEDIFTREILAAQISRHHDRWLVLSASKQAVINTGTLPDIFHSDQGTEFMAHACTTFWEEQKVAISVSDTGSPWQNGYKESFFGHFKHDLGRTDRFNSPGEFIAAIYQQVRYYNHERIHTSIKMPPSHYAQLVSENTRRVLGT
jgi:transposase InsO family protein